MIMKGLAIFPVAIFSLGFMSCDSANSPKPAPAPTSQTASGSTGSSGVSSPPAENWKYSADTDEMTGKSIAWACTSAPEGADLCLRKKEGRLESYVSFNSVSDGQFLCLEDDCRAKARFDDGQTITFSGVEAAGGKTTMLFIEPATNLVTRLRKAKTLKLQPPIYENSGEVLHFEVSGLKW